MDPETSKARLRALVRARRAERAELSRASSRPDEPTIAAALTEAVARMWPGDDLTGRTVVAYAGLPGEPDLDPALDDLLRRGARVVLPIVTRLGEPLRFGEVSAAMSTLRPQGRWGIREPAAQWSATALLAEAVPDLILVPALGFGPGGARLGNGGGFYDRTFGPFGEAPLDHGQSPRTARGPRVVGVCFADETDLPGLTVEPWDLRIGEILTEDGLEWLSAEK
ncbi:MULTISPECIES: 5-formyltetrahydrofolate cyclo-ligase [Brevibacterium]|uniref:5-formyltetrahydrofolate cyclo-ligase n=1 Tax=Brevibacterium TaxID=1696 RepID=UPI002012E29C|nr:5-formyltetrahydrofolate cyclo-ligase [Brevibacterium sp. W7.2]